MDNVEEIQHLKPEIREKRLWNLNNFFLSIVILLIISVIFLIIRFVFDFELIYIVIIACFLIIIYSIILFFLLEPKILREINKTTIKTIKTPSLKEVIIEKPIQIMHEMEKKIYITNPRKKLNIPKYDFLGSSQTKTYHKKTCRFSKLIKKKYKILNNDPNYFIKNNYKPCDICILKTKKV
jgi:c-di-AMP phosphodiesterase-like protein